MQKAEAEGKKDTLFVTENQELESVPRGTVELSNKEMVSFVNGEHKEAPLQGEKQPVPKTVVCHWKSQNCLLKSLPLS